MDQFHWNLLDYLFMGGLVLVTVMAVIFVFSFLKNVVLRFVVGAILILLALLVWAELSVGVFGTSFAGS